MHDLRRDLRDADHDRYRLRSQLESHRKARTTANRLLGATIIVAGGLTSALWLTLPSRQDASAAVRPTGASTPTALADAVADTVARTPAHIDPAPADAGHQRPSVAPPVAAAAPAQKKARLRPRTTRPRDGAAATERVRQHLKADRTPDSNRPAQMRPSRPRPLSPGEFGRQASL